MVTIKDYTEPSSNLHPWISDISLHHSLNTPQIFPLFYSPSSKFAPFFCSLFFGILLLSGSDIDFEFMRVLGFLLHSIFFNL